MKYLSLCMMILACWMDGYTQPTLKDLWFVDSDNEFFKTMSSSKVPAGWMVLDTSFNLDIDTLFDDRSAWGISSASDIIEISRDTFEFTRDTTLETRVVVRYKQTYKGIIIDNTDISIHINDSKPYLIHGYVEEDISYDTSGMVSASYALSVALDSLDSVVSEYAWENSALEDSLQIELGDTSATFYPESNLYFINPYSKWASADSIVLLYEFVIHCSDWLDPLLIRLSLQG